MIGGLLEPYDYDKKLSFLRLILSVAVMIAWAALPGGSPGGWHAVALTLLILNTAYSTATFAISKRHIPGFVSSYSHWIDLGLYASLVAIDYSNYRLYVLGVAFAIAAASNRDLRCVLRVTGASVVLVALITFAYRLSGVELDLTEAISLTLYLLIFGLVIAYWGERRKILERRLLFLTQIPQIANPRFGIDQTVEMILQRLQSFYGAESCLIVMTDAVAQRLRFTA